MTTGRKVEAGPLFARPLELSVTKEEAWAHLVKHVLNHMGEFGSWGILIPELQAALDAGRRKDLYEKAQIASLDRVPSDLEYIWPAFLDLITSSVEEGVRREWYWEEKPGAEPGPIKVFAYTGILAYLDSTVVRTGFVPYRDDLPPGCVIPLDRCYQLFLACWRRVRFKYRRALQEGRFVRAPTAFQDLMRKEPDRTMWGKLP